MFGGSKMKKFISLFSIAILFAVFSFNKLVQAQDQKLYLGYNLWYQKPDKIMSLNLKIGKRLPAGVEVDQVRKSGGRTPRVSFRVVKLDQRFQIFFYRKYHPRVEFEDFVNTLIQSKNFNQLTSGFSQMEIDNVLAGTISPGMSKQAVLVAYGPPPQHRTPSTDASKWLYWTTRSRSFAVNFDPSGLALDDGATEAPDENQPDETIDDEEDTAPPSIVITDPPLNRGMKAKHNDKTYIVRGNAKDPSGVFEVLVNGTEANLQAGGDFWAQVLLAVGENEVVVKATDTEKNSAEKKFVIIRGEDSAAPPIAMTKQDPLQVGYGKYYGLIIAVQDYGDPSINDLDQPVRDARKLKNILIQDYTFEPQNVTILENPNRSQVIEKFEDLSRKVTNNDNLFIFYAGHGYWDDKFQQGYWLPSNATKDSRTQWISNSTVVDYIRGIQSNHTLLVTDACFSGGIFKTRKAFSDVPPAVNELYKLPSRKAMTSGTLKEVPDRSVFVEYLSKRLEENSDKYLSAEQLFVSFRTAVINNSPIQQIPQFGEIRQCGDEGGDFIFIKK